MSLTKKGSIPALLNYFCEDTKESVCAGTYIVTTLVS